MRIKELLKEKGITQQHLSEMLGVSYQSIKQTLNAPSVTTATLEKIATALDVPMWQLFAAPSEVLNSEEKLDGLTIKCPYCGRPIPLHVGELHEQEK